MPTKYVGSGGDFSDWNLALQSILTGGAISDDITFIQISDVHDTHVSLVGYNVCYVENHLVQFLNPDKYKTYLESANGGLYFYFSMMTNWGDDAGQVIIDGLDIIASADQGVDKPCMYLRNIDGYYRVKITAKNNRINGNNLAANGMQFYTQSYGDTQRYDISNNRIGGIKNENGSMCLYGYMNGLATTTERIFIENNSIIRPPKGLGIVNTPQNIRVDYKNNSSCCSDANDGGYDWSSILSNSTINNCADSDDSMVSGDNTVHGVTMADFVSVDSTSDDFLKIPIGSKLRDTGTTDVSSWNSSDFGGLPRPNGRGVCSIGAHEPISVNITLTATINSQSYSKTKRLDL